MTEHDNLDLRDEDRLPWLEAVDDEDQGSGVAPGKLIAGVVAALLVLGLVIGGVYWLKNRPTAEGDGTLIAAPQGEYKVKPDAAGAGMKVEGQGDAAFATSEGAEAGATIDTNALPEAPVTGAKAAPAPVPVPGKAGGAVSASVGDAGKMGSPAVKPVAPKPAAVAAVGGAQVQLGAFGSEAKANQVWAGLSRRFTYLAPLTKVIVPVPAESGTVYRLRVNAGTGAQASALCGKLKAAGETCLVP